MLQASNKNYKKALRSQIQTKIMLVMRLTALLLIAAFIQVHGSGMSQSITFSGKDIAMKKVFQVIEQQTGYVVSGDKKILTSSKPVSVSANNMPVEQFLDLVLREQDIAYRLRGNNIFLSRKPPLVEVGPTAEPTTAPVPPAVITGTIRSRSGELLIGVSVRLKGTKSGTTTNNEGFFRLMNVNKNAILQISSIGYETIEIGIREAENGFIAYAVKKELEENIKTLSGQVVNIELVLETSNNQMNQVIVNGYSNINKNNFTGSAVTIKGKSC